MDGRPPPVSLCVVIPCFNSARTLPRQLAALAAQDWNGSWDVVIADNGSTDDSASVAEGWSDRLPGLEVIDASARRGAAHARNAGAASSTRPYIVWIDADDEVAPGFLSAMALALAESDFCGGAWQAPGDGVALEALPGASVSGWRAALADRGFLDAVGACNGIGVRRTLLDDVGGFNEDMTWGSEDTAFCWSLQLAGFPLVRVPDARVTVYPRDKAKDLWRQQVSWGIGAVDAFRRFREHGAPRSNTVGAVIRWVLLVASAPAVLVIPRWRYRWMGTAARRWGRLRGTVRFRTLYL